MTPFRTELSEYCFTELAHWAQEQPRALPPDPACTETLPEALGSAEVGSTSPLGRSI